MRRAETAQTLMPGLAGSIRQREGMMTEPEASVSALVFHHPVCAYFTAVEVETVGVG